MRKGLLPRSVARSLPAGSIEPDYAPDGLTEADVDALISEMPAAIRPVRSTERREVKRVLRQVTRTADGSADSAPSSERAA